VVRLHRPTRPGHGAAEKDTNINYLISGKAFQTVLGDLTYNRKGDITQKDYVIYVWRNDPSGTIKYVEQ
jgi:ABC-type branched-subunit amino acid transport system substrate-binding protein